LGNALRAQGKHAEAVCAFRKALKFNSDYAEGYYSLGNALRDQGELAEAVTAYHKAIALKPNYAEAHCNLGLVLSRQGQFADAVVKLKRGHQLGSRNPPWHYPSAQWLRQAEQLVELDSKLPRVLKGHSTPANSDERLALALYCLEHK